MMTTAKLLLHCPDKPGILAEVTDFITVNKGNIIYLDQYVDHVENIFFMRIEWELKDFLVPQEKIEDYFRTLYGQKYEMDFRLYFSDVKPRMAIFVSKTEIDTYKQNDVYVLRALLYEVLMLLDREYKKVNMEEETISKEVGNIHINKFMKLVESHMTEQHSVQYYADKLCITPNYLNEIVTSTKGISAKQYIRNKVMDEAKRLLTYTDFPISDIAFELHFSTVSYFIRSFRQHTGETPLLYRKTHKP
jgi:AraC-like DNA-binding protein